MKTFWQPAKRIINQFKDFYGSTQIKSIKREERRREETLSGIKAIEDAKTETGCANPKSSENDQ